MLVSCDPIRMDVVAMSVRAEMAAESTNTRRRVKLYMLNENRAWDDNGTGHVAVTYSEKPKFMMIDVKSEVDGQLLAPMDIFMCGDISRDSNFATSVASFNLVFNCSFLQRFVNYRLG